MPYVIFFIICAIWGSSFILMDRAAVAFSPAAVGFWRVVGGAVVLVITAIIRRQSIALPRPYWLHILLVSAVANAIPFVLQPYLIANGFGHGRMGMMIVFVPLLTIIFSVPLLNIRPTARQLLGVLGGLVCIGLIILDTQQKGISAYQLALALTVPLVYAWGNTYVKRFLSDMSVVTMTTWILLLDGVVLLGWVLFCDPASLLILPDVSTSEWVTGLVSLVVLGVVATGFAMLLFNYLIIRQGPLFAGMVTYVIPTGAVMMGGLDGERVTFPQIAALAGVLAMVALVQYRTASARLVQRELQPALETENE